MHKKSFTFGVGAGILLMTALFFFLYGYQKDELILNSAAAANKMTEQEIIDQAKKLGMAFYIADGEPPQTAAEPEVIPTPPVVEMESELEAAPEITEPPQEAPAGPVSVNIPENALASRIAEIFYEHNLIEDQKSFIDYLSENNSTKALRYGDFEIPAGADYAEILSIIKSRA